MGNGVGMVKCSTIRHIVRIRQMLRRWGLRAASALRGAPAGHVVVCVGSSSRRFVVRVAHLNHPVFRQLLRQAEEEYGFSSRPGPLALPCDESLFEHILRHLSSSSSSSSRFVTLEDFRKTSPPSSSSLCCCCRHSGHRSAGWHSAESVPLLRSEKPVW